MNTLHQPVLLDQVLELLDPKKGQSFFDGTSGYGGHAKAIIDRLGGAGRVVLVDRDSQAIAALVKRFGGRASLIRSDFLEAAKSLVADGSLFDQIILDLGVSSPQLDEGSRGFSFKSDGPLDMRMDSTQSLTAAEVVNTYSQDRLAGLIAQYGEEHRSKNVARAIVAGRPITTTAELANIVRRAVGPSGDIDPATRTFQAIRIEVNNELKLLEQTLPLLERLLAPGGRMAVIAFHSLEDRIVKSFFTTQSRDCICPPKQPVCTCNHKASLKILTRKPIQGDKYNQLNPRARSAKLRVAEKLKQKEGK